MFRGTRKFKSLHMLFLSMTFFIVYGCGDGVSFNGMSLNSENLNPYVPPDGIEDPAAVTDQLAWLWGCDGERIEDPKEGGNYVKGAGSFNVALDDIDRLSVVFSGKTCYSKQQKRDIVFVIDVSNSMNYAMQGNPASDPIKSNSCGRLKAMEKVLDTLRSNKDARFGVVTFAGTVVDKSSRLFDSEEALYKDLLDNSASSSILNIICGAANGTNYEEGLKAGGVLLDNAEVRGNVVREMYFISDGDPYPATAHGTEVARELREDTSIATIMLAYLNDSIMKESIASKDQYGNPLHARVDQADKLASALSALMDNRVTKAQLLYRAIGEEKWVMEDITRHLQSQNFNFKTSIVINREKYPNGIELIYKYWDRFTGYWEHKGELQW